jgi:hypothetical protein
VTTDLQAFALIVTAEPYYAVRRPSNYLTQQGVPESSTTAAGFGKTRPVASNDTSEGRQQNRRVELIVSGEVIGTKIVSLSLLPVVAVTSPQ